MARKDKSMLLLEISAHHKVSRCLHDLLAQGDCGLAKQVEKHVRRRRAKPPIQVAQDKILHADKIVGLRGGYLYQTPVL